MSRVDEIEAKMKKILERNSHWKSCQDGSYEMALSMDGYYKLNDELKSLRDSKVE